MNGYDEQDYHKRFDMALWIDLLRFAKPYRKKLLFLAVIMACVGGIDVLFPLMTRYAIDQFIVPASLDGIGLFAALYALMVCLQGLNVWLLIITAGKIETSLVYDIRKFGFKKLQVLSFGYYDRTEVGWIMARMTSDTQRLGETISWGLVDIAWGGSMMIGIMIVLLVMQPTLALIVLSVTPVLAFVSLYFQKRILAGYRDVRKTNSKITGAFNEGITGAKTTKTLVREDRNTQEFQTITERLRTSSVRVAVVSSIFMPIVLSLGSIGTGFALWFGGSQAQSQVLTYGTLVAFISYTVQFFEPINQLARIFTELQSAQASAERVLSMIHEKPSIEDRPEVIKAYGDSFEPKKENWPSIRGEISFEQVSFWYKRGEPVLDQFNLHVHAGETIALVGETGSGKSTIVNLLCRFYEPSEGMIAIDGADYRDRSQLWLQSNIGYVLQVPHLFSGTIRENIRYGRQSATDEEVTQAAKLVYAHDFISKMDQGYDSQVNEGGNRLSTGQKQLISFARAIVADPRIFVFDEATSSIDTETEQMIQKAIGHVLHGRTSFIIAHRLSTIRSADRILVITDGKVVEQGTHPALIAKKGAYYRLYAHQFMHEAAERMMDEVSLR